MLTAYIAAALHRAQYEKLAEQEGYFGAIDGLQGVWAQADNLEDCRNQLREVLEDWIVLGLRKGHTLPVIDGIALAAEEVA
jgi:predicted RNase H-like HicB family nuclease